MLLWPQQWWGPWHVHWPGLLRRVRLQLVLLQVFHLQEAGIESAYLSGTVSWEEQRATMDKLRMSPPGIKVLFVTPEKVAASDNLMRLLDDLHSRHVLVRRPGPAAPCLLRPLDHLPHSVGQALGCPQAQARACRLQRGV